MTGNEQARGLDDVLSALHDVMESGTAEDVRRLADAHPGYRREILAFAAQWLIADRTSDDEDLAPTSVETGDELLTRYWATRSGPTADPFASLDYEALEVIAERCRIDLGIMRKLTQRLIDEGSIPGKLVVWLAEEAQCDTSAMFSFLSTPVGVDRADYFAPAGRKVPGKISFGDAVRRSDLPPETKRFWLGDARG